MTSSDGIAKHGIRNSHLIAIAPTGTISLLAGNVSSGLEPIFAASYARKVLAEDGTPKEFVLTDYALRALARDDGAATGAPNGFCHSQRASRPRPSRHAGRLAAIRRQFDLQDDQCPGRLTLSTISGRSTISPTTWV